MGVVLAGNDIYVLIALIVHIKLGIAILSVIFRHLNSWGWSSISGGNSKSVTGFDDWRGGACFFCEN